jgi:long-chain acyl-CoA synthetase
VRAEIKLEDVPELGYLSSGVPQKGEVLIRGLNVFRGYYKNEEETCARSPSHGSRPVRSDACATGATC